MAVKNIQTITALSSGTLNVNVSKIPTSLIDTASVVRVIGTVTLSGNLNISPIGTPSKNTAIKILWEASVTITPLSGNHIFIFGETVPDELAAKNFIAECIYDGAAWVVNILPDFAETGIVDSDRLATDSVSTAKIQDDAVTLAKLEAAGIGKIIYGDGSGNPKYLTIQDAEFIIGDTILGATAQTISGDAAISKTGALTIANSAVTTAKIDDGAVTAEKLTAGARKDSFSIRLDFDDASKLGGQIFLPVCYNCTVDAVKATLVGAAGSDLTVIIKDAFGTVMTGSQIDVPSATVVGNVITSTVTGNNTMTGGTNMILEPSAAGTLAGHLHLTFCVTRDN